IAVETPANTTGDLFRVCHAFLASSYSAPFEVDALEILFERYVNLGIFRFGTYAHFTGTHAGDIIERKSTVGIIIAAGVVRIKVEEVFEPGIGFSYPSVFSDVHKSSFFDVRPEIFAENL